MNLKIQTEFGVFLLSDCRINNKFLDCGIPKEQYPLFKSLINKELNITTEKFKIKKIVSIYDNHCTIYDNIRFLIEKEKT